MYFSASKAEEIFILLFSEQAWSSETNNARIERNGSDQ
jgi:hypothetical protein